MGFEQKLQTFFLLLGDTSKLNVFLYGKHKREQQIKNEIESFNPIVVKISGTTSNKGAQAIIINPFKKIYENSEEPCSDFWNIFLYANKTDGKQAKHIAKLEVKRSYNIANNPIKKHIPTPPKITQQ